MNQFVVIVDQSDPPGDVNNITAFGPYSLITAEGVMGDINSEAMAGEINLNRIIVAPFYQQMYNVNRMAVLLEKSKSTP